MRTIIHIFSSMDGRISGSFMASPAAEKSRKAYARIREEYAPDAILYGSVTAQAFAGNPSKQPVFGADVPDGDYTENATLNAGGEFLVNLDPAGEVWWRDPVLLRSGRPDATVIEVVTRSTPKEFLAYLRKVGVSYIVAGDEHIDCAEMAHKLERLLDVKTLLVCGGGKADWTLLESGCVDEVSVVMAPIASGQTGVATIFDQMAGIGEHEPIVLSLSEVSQVEGDGLHIVYKAR